MHMIMGKADFTQSYGVFEFSGHLFTMQMIIQLLATEGKHWAPWKKYMNKWIKVRQKSPKKKSSAKNILNASAKPLWEQRLDFNKATQNLAPSRTLAPLLDPAAFRTRCSRCKGLCHTWHRWSHRQTVRAMQEEAAKGVKHVKIHLRGRLSEQQHEQNTSSWHCKLTKSKECHPVQEQSSLKKPQQNQAGFTTVFKKRYKEYGEVAHHTNYLLSILILRYLWTMTFHFDGSH